MKTTAQSSRPEKPVVVQFNGGNITSDAGLHQLQRLDQLLHLTQRINNCIRDPRNPVLITHPQDDLIAQRLYAIANGYEDLNDHETLRYDAAFRHAIKRNLDDENILASDSTLCRLENRISEQEINDLSKLFVTLFLESFLLPPDEIILDFDATNDSVHGEQIGSHFNAYYDEHCFLPLYVFAGQQLVYTRLRDPKLGQAHGTVEVLDFLVTEIRKKFPHPKILFRSDAGFYGPELVDYCEQHDIRYILGFSTNAKLKQMTWEPILAAKMLFQASEDKTPLRLFREYQYRAGTWQKDRKIIVKAERLPDPHQKAEGKENTRYILTDLEGDPQELYEQVYCARGDMENRIKEQQLMLFADRTSCHEFLANQFRLLLSGFAYVLWETLRRVVLKGTKWSSLQCSTLRLWIGKVGAVMTESVRRVVIQVSNAYPYRAMWERISHRLDVLCRWSK
jgi:hypothetical protein